MASRKAVDLDNVDVDFSGVAAPPRQPAARGPSSPIALLDSLEGKPGKGANTSSTEMTRAYDPAMARYVQQRYAQQQQRRRQTLFALPNTPPASNLPAKERAHDDDHGAKISSTSVLHSNNNSSVGEASGTRWGKEHRLHTTQSAHELRCTPSAALTALLTTDVTPTHGAVTAKQNGNDDAELQARRVRYLKELHDFCHASGTSAAPNTAPSSHPLPSDAAKSTMHARPAGANANPASSATTTTMTSVAGSDSPLWPSIFAQGVPDIEPWDRWAFVLPRYDTLLGSNKDRDGSDSSSAQTMLQRSAMSTMPHYTRLPETFFSRSRRSATALQPPSAHQSHAICTDGASLALAQASLEGLGDGGGGGGGGNVVENSMQYSMKFKTKEELRAERRSRLAQRHARERKTASVSAADFLTTGDGANVAGSLSLDVQANNHSDDSVGKQYISRTKANQHDRLSNKALVHGLLTRSVLNPLGAEGSVYAQYEQRFLDHQRRNHDRHVAALPHQLAKRVSDTQRRARERPVLRVYRIFPIYNSAHLGKLRHYANDQQLRGFVLWVSQIDALVVLSGGELACRHLDRWILHKMQWEHRHTKAARLCSLPLPHACTFSFCQLPSGSASSAAAQRHRLTDGPAGAQGHTSSIEVDAAKAMGNYTKECSDEKVFMSFVDSVGEGEKFMRVLPAPTRIAGVAATGEGEKPWADLSAIWRLAFLEDGLRELQTDV